MNKGHDKGHKWQMSDREVMKLALEALDQYIEKELTVGQRYTNEGQQLLEAHAILRQALNHVPDTMKMTEPDMGIDRGAWADVPDATKWVDELRGGDEEPPNSTTDVVESEPVAWCEINSIGEIMYFDGRAMIMPGKFGNDLHTVPLYTAPPKREWVGVTQEDIDIAFDDTQEGGGFDDFARAIEAKLREKNLER